MKHLRNDCTAHNINFGGGCLNCGATTNDLLREATARPWGDASGTVPMEQRNFALARLAVNTFEQAREALRELVEQRDLTVSGCKPSKGAWEAARAALAAMEGGDEP